MTEYRASFDATIKFSNGGDLTVHGFRVDIPSPDVGEDGIAALFVASPGLLMTDLVTLANAGDLYRTAPGNAGRAAGSESGKAARRRPAGRTQPCHPRRDGHLSRASWSGHHPVPDQGRLA
jgi:hypothetical protein